MYGFPICLSVETLLEWISDKSLFGVVKMETQSCQAILSGQVSLSFGAEERKVMGTECEMLRSRTCTSRFGSISILPKHCNLASRRQAGLAFRVILSFNKVIMYFKPDQFRIKLS